MSGLHRVSAGTFLLLWTLLWSTLLLELGLRVYFSIRVGPDVLLWGSQWHRTQQQNSLLRGQDVFDHDNLQAGYSKYFPHQKRTDVDYTGTAFSVSINHHGFRGADHTLEKPDDVLRVLALGASSTFGFGNRDDETYPYLLEQLLSERLRGNDCRGFARAEVINLGIPHLNTSEIAALFVSEGLAYKPDAVTVYSGYNNTLGLGQHASLKAWSRRLLLVNFIRVAREQNAVANQTMLDAETEFRNREFIAGLQRILEAGRAANIAVLPVSQQVRALAPGLIRQQTVTYENEMQLLQAKLSAHGQLSLLEAKVLMHSSFMRALRRWAGANELQLVDVIALLDQHRYLLTSYVHLAPLANQLLALALADALASKLDCPQLLLPPAARLNSMTSVTAKDSGGSH